MADAKTVEVATLNPSRMGDYLEFFETRAFTDNPRWSSCYCYFPYHDPDKINWQARTGTENRAAICACIGAGVAQGYLAYQDGKVVGWCNAGTSALYPMLRELRAPPDKDVGAIMCFVVAPEQRGMGVARALLEAACSGLRAQGLRAVQAKPRRAAESAAQNHFGPLSMYLAAGFVQIGEDDDGDVFVEKLLA